MANVTPMQFFEENGIIKTTYEKDRKIKKGEMIVLLNKVLGDNFVNIDYKRGQRTLTGYYKSGNNKTFFMMANITFMGGTEGQHPKDLKRIQYNVEWRNFYNKYKNKGKVLWMGVYSYKDLNIFGVFEPESYLKKHKNKSMVTKKGKRSAYSCHIYLNDLLQGYKNGVFDKIDKNKNHIWAIGSDYLKDYFDGNYGDNPILSVIKQINSEKINWNNWIKADEAIPFMKGLKSKTGFNNWKQNLWNGWYIEGIYSEYLYEHPSQYVEYVETSKNIEIKEEYNQYKLDLAFPQDAYRFIGDLKNVCADNSEASLNDESHVKAALEKYKKIWFVIYLHEKKPGKTNDYEMVKWRNYFIKEEGEWEKGKEFDEKSAPKTPHSIKMKEMIIVELNEVTKDKFFSIKKQYGLNSNGDIRNNKFYISKKLIKEITDDSLVVYRESHM